MISERTHRTMFPELSPAHAAPEALGRRRDDVRLMVSPAVGRHHVRFAELARFFEPGDLLVVNRSATRKAAVDTVDGALTVHFSTQLAENHWILEFRRRRGRTPHRGPAPAAVCLPGGASLRVAGPFNDDLPTRLWRAELDGVGDPDAWFAREGRWIRYAYARGPQSDEWFQTIFASEPGSAEMPSAGRPFTARVLQRLSRRGVEIASLVHHCGVSSQEAGESPHAERYRVPDETWGAVRRVRSRGGHVVAVGTTVVRALETVARGGPLAGLTDLVVGPDDRVRSVDGIVSGFHPPDASHLDILTAIASDAEVRPAYEAARQRGYRSHEFGDVHLLWAAA